MSWLYLWFNPCAFYYRTFAHGTAGAVGARLSLRPLPRRGPTNCKTRAKPRCENEPSCFPVIARRESDEAIHLSPRGKMDCFAEPVIRRRFAPAGWLAMTVLGSLKFNPQIHCRPGQASKASATRDP